SGLHHIFYQEYDIEKSNRSGGIQIFLPLYPIQQAQVVVLVLDCDLIDWPLIYLCWLFGFFAILTKTILFCQIRVFFCELIIRYIEFFIMDMFNFERRSLASWNGALTINRK